MATEYVETPSGTLAVSRGAGSLKYVKNLNTGDVQVGGVQNPIRTRTLAKLPVNASSILPSSPTLAKEFKGLTDQIQHTAALKAAAVKPVTVDPGVAFGGGKTVLTQGGGGPNVVTFGLGTGTPGFTGGTTLPGSSGGIPGLSTGIAGIDQLLGAGYNWLLGQLSGGQGPGTGGAGGSLAGATSNSCPQGYSWDGTQCVATGIQGAVQRFLPGGASGTLADIYGEARLGRYGVALVPAQVGQVASLRTGMVNPILRCPRGMVLGKDNLCYDSLTKTQRKWPKPRKPLFTGGDLNALTRANKLKEKAKEIAQDSGWHVYATTRKG